MSTSSYDDPYFTPPADIRGDEARAYEDKIVSLLRGEMLGRSGPVTFETIERRGERPDTEIIIRYIDARYPGRRFTNRTYLWRDRTYGCWPCEDVPELSERLQPAISVAAAIGSAWLASELEIIQRDS